MHVRKRNSECVCMCACVLREIMRVMPRRQRNFLPAHTIILTLTTPCARLLCRYNVPIHHSRPNSPNKLFLNFNGQIVTDSAWNNNNGRGQDGGYSPITGMCASIHFDAPVLDTRSFNMPKFNACLSEIASPFNTATCLSSHHIHTPLQLCRSIRRHARRVP